MSPIILFTSSSLVMGTPPSHASLTSTKLMTASFKVTISYHIMKWISLEMYTNIQEGQRTILYVIMSLPCPVGFNDLHFLECQYFISWNISHLSFMEEFQANAIKNKGSIIEGHGWDWGLHSDMLSWDSTTYHQHGAKWWTVSKYPPLIDIYHSNCA